VRLLVSEVSAISSTRARVIHRRNEFVSDMESILMTWPENTPACCCFNWDSLRATDSWKFAGRRTVTFPLCCALCVEAVPSFTKLPLNVSHFVASYRASAYGPWRPAEKESKPNGRDSAPRRT